MTDNPRITCCKIVNWITCLKFAEETKISNEGRDLIFHFLRGVETRLGSRGVDDLKVSSLQTIKNVSCFTLMLSDDFLLQDTSFALQVFPFTLTIIEILWHTNF